MQKFIAIGNLTKDPEWLTTSNGTSVCKFGIAIPREYKDSNGERQVDFFNCTAWKGLAENIYKYCVKGSKVSIIGQVQNRTYQGKNGRMTVTEIIVENVEFLSPKEKVTQSAVSKLDANMNNLMAVDDDEIPF